MKSVIGAAPSREQMLALFKKWQSQHPLHTHAWLNGLFDDEMNDIEHIKPFLEVLYEFCETFHDCSWAIGRSATSRRLENSEAIRKAIADNLHDEYGGADAHKGHLCLMRNFLGSVGYTPADIQNIQINPGAQKFMRDIIRFCEQEHPIAAIGCVFVGAECNGSEYFRKIYESFKRKPCLQSADLYVLKIHSDDDIEHRERMLQLIEPFLRDPEARRLVQLGFNESVHLFQQLWTSMALYQPLVLEAAQN